MRALILIAVLAGVVSRASAQVADQNSWNFMVRRTQNCAAQYGDLIESKYFANNETCKVEVKKALETYEKANCPSTAAKGSMVWQCMSGWNGATVDQARINDWARFLSGCEVLYIAQRVNSAESEDGFVWKDNSCFGRFINMGQFVKFLEGTDGNGGDGGASSITLTSVFHVLLAVIAAFLLLR